MKVELPCGIQRMRPKRRFVDVKEDMQQAGIMVTDDPVWQPLKGKAEIKEEQRTLGLDTRITGFPFGYK